MNKYTMILCSLYLFFGGINMLHAQKRPLDEDAYKKWKYISRENISADGLWVSYEHANKDCLQVLYLYGKNNTDTLWNCKNGVFSPDSHLFSYYKINEKSQKGKTLNTFYIKDLQTGRLDSFPKVSYLSFKGGKKKYVSLLRETHKVDTLSGMKEKQPKEQKFDLVLYDSSLKSSVSFSQVSKHFYSPEGNWLLLYSQKWYLYHLNTNKKYDLPLATDSNISLYSFSKNEDKLAFLSTGKQAKDAFIYLYDLKRFDCIDSLATQSKALPQGFEITVGKLAFSQDEKKLYFKIVKKKDSVDSQKPIGATYKPQIWAWDKTFNYLNHNILTDESLFCSYALKDKKITLLSSEEMPYLQFPDGESEKMTIGFSNKPYLKYEGIETGPIFDTYLVNMEDGKHQKILERKYYNPTISSDKKYIVWFEPDARAWYGMHTETLEKKNLTGAINDLFYNDEVDRPMHYIHLGSIGWSEKGHDVFINSKYDLWKIDAAGEKKPVCLTKSLGKERKIVFRPIKKSESQRYFNQDEFYFTAFQPETKKAGYYRLKNDRFTELIFTDHYYSDIKFSEDGEHCIWKRSSFVEYPEIYYSDAKFTNAQKVSVSDSIQGEYNWATAELVQWTTYHKDTLQGILCKPEDFDPSKKYPMIVYFYEKKSDELHRYKIPSPIGTVINWPYCASNGYLVFVPDVAFRAGEPGQSAYDAIVSGVENLAAKYNFIDKERIALNGHSWGGYQTAYLVTRTNLFKAAVAGAPVANMTSAYGAVRWGTGKARMFQYESGQSRIGGTLWEKPFEYIKNSPLFFAPQIETPLLIMHNDGDGSVVWEQGIELFLALRRLGKPAWLFNYKGQDHKLLKWEYRLDYSRRVMEFYDYYLRNGEKPNWFDGQP